MAISMEVATDPNVIAWTANAPLRMAGQTRFPLGRQDESANPLAGQSGFALGCSEATASPNLANWGVRQPQSAHKKRAAYALDPP